MNPYPTHGGSVRHWCDQHQGIAASVFVTHLDGTLVAPPFSPQNTLQSSNSALCSYKSSNPRSSISSSSQLSAVENAPLATFFFSSAFEITWSILDNAESSLSLCESRCSSPSGGIRLVRK